MANIMTEEKFIKKVYEKHGNSVEIISKYNGGLKPIEFIYHCKKHGDVKRIYNAKNLFTSTFQPCEDCNVEKHIKSSSSAINKTQEQLYSELKSVVDIKGGKMLFEKWTTAKDKHSFMCKQGHIFKTNADSIINKKQCVHIAVVEWVILILNIKILLNQRMEQCLPII